jgi:MoxR-like ATPase
MLDAHATGSPVEELDAVLSASEVEQMIELTRKVHVAPALKEYIVDIADATRRHPLLSLGMSPRAALALQRAARSLAMAAGRDFVIPDDLKTLARPVLEHRLLLTPEGQLSGSTSAEVIDAILASVPVPAGRPS